MIRALTAAGKSNSESEGDSSVTDTGVKVLVRLAVRVVARVGLAINQSTPLESNRRDADLQYALHQPDYFASLAHVGIEGFEGQPSYHPGDQIVAKRVPDS